MTWLRSPRQKVDWDSGRPKCGQSSYHQVFLVFDVDGVLLGHRRKCCEICWPEVWPEPTCPRPTSSELLTPAADVFFSMSLISLISALQFNVELEGGQVVVWDLVGAWSP